MVFLTEMTTDPVLSRRFPTQRRPESHEPTCDIGNTCLVWYDMTVQRLIALEGNIGTASTLALVRLGVTMAN